MAMDSVKGTSNRTQKLMTTGAGILNTVMGMIKDNILLKLLTTTIIMVLLIFIIRYIYKYSLLYPRPKVLSSFINIAGKFDKSTGLDIELAEILSSALTDYIYTPSHFCHELNSNSESTISDEFITSENNIYEITFIDYIKKSLFEDYNIDNSFHKRLRKLIEYKDIVFNDDSKITVNNVNTDEVKHPYLIDKDIAEGNNYLKLYYKTTVNNPNEDPQKMNKTAYETTINKKLDDDEAVNQYITNLDKKDDLEWDKKPKINKQKIKEFFLNILKTQSLSTDSSIKKKEVYKNIFLRNVLYVIILDSNDDITKQLNILENNNIVSYINPEIYKSIDNPGIKLFERYGKYLHINDNYNLNSFKKIFNTNTVLPNFINDNILSSNYNITNEDKIISDIKYEIKDELKKIESDKYIENNFNLIFTQLLKSNSDKFKISTLNDIRENYNNYKENLEKITGTDYDTKNEFVNKLYNLHPENYKKKSSIIDIKFDIHKVDDNIEKILNIYNYIIIFENFFKFIEDIDNFDDIYNELMNYLWYFENFTTTIYYDTKNTIDVYLFSNDDDKTEFLKSFYIAINFALYIRDMNIINIASLSTVTLYNVDDEIPYETLLNLSKYYMSFMEIKLAFNFVNDVKSYKEYRTHFDILKDFLYPEWKYLGEDVMWKKIIIHDWTFENISNQCDWLWGPIKDFFNDENKITCFAFMSEIRSKLGIDCPDNFKNKEDTIEHFTWWDPTSWGGGGGISGIAKNLLKIPKAIGDIAKLLADLPKIISKIFDLIVELLKVIPKLVKFLIDHIVDIFKILENLITYTVRFIDALLQIKSLKELIQLVIQFAVGMFLYIVFNIVRIIITIPVWTYNNKPLYLGLAIIIFLGLPIFIAITLFKISVVALTLIIFTIIAFIVLILDSLIHMHTGKYSMFSKLLYKYMFACENSPFAWYRNSRYDLENKNMKGIFCNLSCFSNYRLTDNKMFCESAPTNVPYYCPQPLLYRFYRNESSKGPNNIKSFFINNYPSLLLSSYETQNEFINNYKNNKKEYYEKCNITNNASPEFNQISKNICANGYNGDDKNISNKVNNICKEIYCSNGKYENFCYKYENKEYYFYDITKSNNKYITNLKRIILIIILFFIFLYIFNTIKISTNNFNNSPDFNNNLFSSKITNNLKSSIRDKSSFISRLLKMFSKNKSSANLMSEAIETGSELAPIAETMSSAAVGAAETMGSTALEVAPLLV